VIIYKAIAGERRRRRRGKEGDGEDEGGGGGDGEEGEKEGGGGGEGRGESEGEGIGKKRTEVCWFGRLFEQMHSLRLKITMMNKRRRNRGGNQVLYHFVGGWGASGDAETGM
jgi:hypothetical protein